MTLERNLKSIFNLPNLITMFRIFAVPFFVWSLASASGDWSRWFSLALFIAIMASDGIDGAIARRRGLITNLGKLLDPIADKALLGAALITLSVLGQLNWLATAVILLRELGITVYRLLVLNKRVVAASAGGKFKTILQSITVGYLISPIPQFAAWLELLGQALVWLTVAITIYSGVQYLLAAWRAR